MKMIRQEFMWFRPFRPVTTPLVLLLSAVSLPLSAQQAVPAGAEAKKTETKTAADAVKESSAEEAGEYNNWVTIGVGQMFVDGDHAAFQRRHQLPDQTFGGIEELHFEQGFGKKGMFKLDTRGIFDSHDFDVKLDISDPDKGFVRGGYREFRTWYDGSGGYSPRTGAWPASFYDEMHVDRREYWVEAGLTLPDWPVFTVKYSYETRNGQKDSTIWGDSTVAGAVRGIVPSFRDINERRHLIQGGGRHTIGNTEFALGLRYELSANDNSLNIHRRPGEASDRYVTQKEGLDTDMFNVHAFTETRFNEVVLMTVAYAFTTLDTDISGSRIYGTGYDPVYDPVFPGRQQRDEGFFNLGGGSQVNQHVANLNLMLTPWANFAIVPAIRIEEQDQDGVASFLESNFGAGGVAIPLDPLTNFRERKFIDVSESLEARYTGVQKWAFYSRAEWTEGQGSLRETEREGIDNPPLLIVQNTDSDRLVQKYVAGANWYPLKKLNVGGQYYYKIRQNDYNHIQDSARFVPPGPSGDLYPAFIRQHDFDTHDMNLRATWRPFGTVTLVSRYDFQLSTIDMQGDLNNTGIALQRAQSSEMTSHIFSESISWSPLARLSLQANFSYVLDRTDTGANFVGGGTPNLVLPSMNNYMNGNFFATYALTEKTDLQGQYFYYRADNYVDNSAVSQPYGVGAEKHGVTTSVLHRLRKNMLWKITYGFFTNHDQTSGGNNDYKAHMLYSSLQYRF